MVNKPDPLRGVGIAREGGDLVQAAVQAVEKLQAGTAQKIWELFPGIAERVQETYRQLETAKLTPHHHDVAHAKRVGEIARQVALQEWQDEHLANLAGIAGLLHNADRTIQAQTGVGRREISREAVEARVKEWIGNDLNATDVTTVVDAVLAHDGKNTPDDSPVKIALQDGDRVVNLDVDLFIRAGQFYADLPPLDYQYFLGDPTATYHDPKTVMRDIAYALDWANPASDVCVRTQLGKQMATSRAQVFQLFFDVLKRQLEEEGM